MPPTADSRHHGSLLPVLLGLAALALPGCGRRTAPPPEAAPAAASQPLAPWTWYTLGNLVVLEGEVAEDSDLFLEGRSFRHTRAAEMGPVRWEVHRPPPGATATLKDGQGRLLATLHFVGASGPVPEPAALRAQAEPPSAMKGGTARSLALALRPPFDPHVVPGQSPGTTSVPAPPAARPQVPRAARPEPRPMPPPEPRPSPLPEPRPTPRPEPRLARATPEPTPEVRLRPPSAPPSVPRPAPRREAWLEPAEPAVPLASAAPLAKLGGRKGLTPPLALNPAQPRTPAPDPPRPPSPRPAPVPAAPPAPVAGPALAASPWPGMGEALNLTHGKPTQRCLLLSFDGGSNCEGATDILDALKARNLRTTLFLTGTFIRKFPDLVRRMAAEGHELGNHTTNHPHFAPEMRRDPKWTRERIQEELLSADRALVELLGRPMDPVWRAPYGEHTAEIRRWVEELGYRHVGWSEGADSLDWATPKERKLYRTGDAILQRLQTRMQKDGGGLIVLMHLGSDRDEHDRPSGKIGAFIDRAQAAGWTFVTAGDMLRGLGKPAWDRNPRMALLKRSGGGGAR